MEVCLAMNKKGICLVWGFFWKFFSFLKFIMCCHVFSQSKTLALKFVFVTLVVVFS